MDTKIEELEAKANKHWKKARKFTDAIKALQDVCKHDWKDNGYDSHKDHYKCSKCGLTDIW